MDPFRLPQNDIPQGVQRGLLRFASARTTLCQMRKGRRNAQFQDFSVCPWKGIISPKNFDDDPLFIRQNGHGHVELQGRTQRKKASCLHHLFGSMGMSKTRSPGIPKSTGFFGCFSNGQFFGCPPFLESHFFPFPGLKPRIWGLFRSTHKGAASKITVPICSYSESLTYQPYGTSLSPSASMEAQSKLVSGDIKILKLLGELAGCFTGIIRRFYHWEWLCTVVFCFFFWVVCRFFRKLLVGKPNSSRVWNLKFWVKQKWVVWKIIVRKWPCEAVHFQTNPIVLFQGEPINYDYYLPLFTQSTTPHTLRRYVSGSCQEHCVTTFWRRWGL